MRAHLASIFEEILVFSLTTSTKKNGSGATLGTLGKEKLKFTKMNLMAKNVDCKFHISYYILSLKVLQCIYEEGRPPYNNRPRA